MAENKKALDNAERIDKLNSAVETLGKEQERELVTDYDAALAEYKDEKPPYKIKFKGKLFEVPRSMPFDFSLFYMRHCVEKVNGKTLFKVPDEKIAEFIERMFGAEFLALLMSAPDVDMNFVLLKLVPDIFGKWGYGINTGEIDAIKNMLTPG